MRRQLQNQRGWHPVFAWWPVVTADGVRVWLETVERRYLYSSWWDDYFEYRARDSDGRRMAETERRFRLGAEPDQRGADRQSPRCTSRCCRGSLPGIASSKERVSFAGRITRFLSRDKSGLVVIGMVILFAVFGWSERYPPPSAPGRSAAASRLSRQSALPSQAKPAAANARGAA